MSSLTSIRNCTDRIEAESLRIRLAEAGIRAFVTGTDMETALGLGGAGTIRMVRLEVPSEDAERAAAILEEDRRKALEAGPWICKRCHEQNEATFDVCWSCSKQRAQDDERGRLETSTSGGEQPSITVEPTPTRAEDGNPYRPIDAATSKPTSSLSDEALESIRSDTRRAFRAAVIGAFLLPPFVCFYSLYLLLSLPSIAYEHRQTRWKLILIWILNIGLITGWIAWWLSFFR